MLGVLQEIPIGAGLEGLPHERVIPKGAEQHDASFGPGALDLPAGVDSIARLELDINDRHVDRELADPADGVLPGILRVPDHGYPTRLLQQLP